MLVDKWRDLLNIDDVGTLRCIDYKHCDGRTGRHIGRLGDELFGELLARAHATQMVEHAANHRSMHADGRGLSRVQRLPDLLQKREPGHSRMIGECVFRQRVDMFHRPVGLPAEDL